MSLFKNKGGQFTQQISFFLIGVVMCTTGGAAFLVTPPSAHAQEVEAGTGALAGIVSCELTGEIGALIGEGLGKVTESVEGFVSDITGGLLGGGSQMVPVDDIQHNTKECVTDVLAKAFARYLLRSMTYSIVSWINSGFDGSPAFIQDLGRFFTDVADQMIGEYIYGSELGFLCSPFELDVRLTLALQYQEYNNPVECTLSDAIGNAEGSVDDFFAGNFSAGGFPRWIEAFTYQQNNPYGAAMIASSRLETHVADAQHKAELEATFGDGFLSFKECTPVEGGETEAGTGLPEETCRIVTPGQIISDHLTFELQTDQLELIEADELNESLSAIVGALANQAFSEIGLFNADLSRYGDASPSEGNENTSQGGDQGGGL